MEVDSIFGGGPTAISSGVISLILGPENTDPPDCHTSAHAGTDAVGWRFPLELCSPRSEE